MAGLVPAIHVLFAAAKKDVDGRNKCGHDAEKIGGRGAHHMTSLSPILSVEGLTVRLPAHADRVNAVENVSFTVGAGEIVWVVGESGSGKSVTAHTVMGLLPKGQLTPTAGRVLLEGEDILTKSPADLRKLRGQRMGMIFQEPMTALNPVG
jgi:peptide/nickel transport system ATP-binding protein